MWLQQREGEWCGGRWRTRSCPIVCLSPVPPAREGAKEYFAGSRRYIFFHVEGGEGHGEIDGRHAAAALAEEGEGCWGGCSLHGLERAGDSSGDDGVGSGADRDGGSRSDYTVVMMTCMWLMVLMIRYISLIAGICCTVININKAIDLLQ